MQGLLGDTKSFNTAMNSYLGNVLTGGGATTMGNMQSLFSGGVGTGAIGGNEDLSKTLGDAFTGVSDMGVLGGSYTQAEKKIKSSGTLIPSLLTSKGGNASVLGGIETNRSNLIRDIPKILES